MTYYYKFIKNNPSILYSKALQKTKIKMIKKYKNPFFWSGFIIVGK